MPSQFAASDAALNRYAHKSAISIPSSQSDSNQKQKAAATIEAAAFTYLAMHVQHDLYSRVITFRSRVRISNRFPLAVALLCTPSKAARSSTECMPENSDKLVDVCTVDSSSDCHLPVAFAEACLTGASTLYVRTLAANQNELYGVSRRGFTVGRDDHVLLTCDATEAKISCCILAVRVSSSIGEPSTRRGTLFTP